MSYELKKPITDTQKADFIVEYNHNQGLRIEDTEMYLFALEPNEIMGEKEIDVEVPEYETIIDEDGNEHQVPIMIEYEDTEVVIDYDEEGNPIGSHEITVIKKKQKTHIEKIVIPYPVINPNYEQEQAEKEAIRIANLHMTRGDVFRGLLLAKGVTRADIRGLIEAMPEETPEQRVQKELALIDFDEALEYYRGVALIDTVGAQLGITPEQMNKFFDTKDWHELISNEEE